MSLSEAYNILYTGALVVLAVLIGIMLLRSIMGPGVTDRILSINMIGTMVIACIAVLSAYLAESYLLDVALIYTMISFVTVLVLASVYIPAKPKRRGFLEDETGEEDGRSGSLAGGADGTVVGESVEADRKAGGSGSGKRGKRL